MTSDPTRPVDVPPPSLARFLAIALSIAGLAAVALIAIVVVFGAPPMGTGGQAVCLEPYSLATLADRSIAFDGTVTAIDGEDVTFHVERAYTGVEGDASILSAPGLTDGASSTVATGTPASTSETIIVVGQRYLVAGDDGVAWGCGFTQPYDAATAAGWSAVFALPSPSIGLAWDRSEHEARGW